MNKNLKALRKSTGLNQQQFWARIGITQSGGSRYEKGDRMPPMPVRALLTIAYGPKHERQQVLAHLRPA